jgi:hypothetical protein
VLVILYAHVYMPVRRNAFCLLLRCLTPHLDLPFSKRLLR